MKNYGKKTRLRKKIGAILMSLVLILTMLPAGMAFGEEGANSSDIVTTEIVETEVVSPEEEKDVLVDENHQEDALGEENTLATEKEETTEKPVNLEAVEKVMKTRGPVTLIVGEAADDANERADGAVYSTFAGAYSKAIDGDTIVLAEDVTLDEVFNVTKDISINASTFTMTFNKGIQYTVAEKNPYPYQRLGW